MKKIFTCIALSLFIGNADLSAKAPAAWTSVPLSQAPSKSLLRMPPSEYLVYQVNVSALKAQLWALSQSYTDAQVMSLPMPDGSFREFRVWETPMMPASLAAQYPDIRTFTAEAVNDKRVTAKLDFTEFGFHAAIFNGESVSFVDPYDNLNDGYYIVHDKRNEDRAVAHRMLCEITSQDQAAPAGAQMESLKTLLPPTDLGKLKIYDPSGTTATGALEPTPATPMALTVNGANIRTYRLALSANNFYCQAATGLGSPTIGQCFSAMTTSMNRVNGVYNREIAVQLNFVANENLIIWPTATGSSNGADPFNGINTNAGACISTNQTTVDTRIGNANYDIGHVFTTGAGGLAGLGVVCNNTQKARGVTGSSSPVGDAFDIDYVCHEMGHQFGSSHTFNNNQDGSCNGNASATHAYEPASGATIMDYAGICNPDNVQANSNPYFSINSLEQIQTYMSGTGGTCPVTTPSGHAPVTVATFTATYNIPYKTPFELRGRTASGSGGDTAITYCWSQYNLGDFGRRLNQTFVSGPIFRSYQPVYTPDRIFPRLSNVLSGVLSNSGEKAPDTARFLTFRQVFRNIQAGYGCIRIPDDSIHINVSSTGSGNGFAGFRVTSQNTTGIVYTGGSTQTVTWNVVGTNLPPVNTPNVDIFMSVDGGVTWAYTVATSVPNTGSASVTIPNPGTATIQARIKVKGSNNIFFNINSNNFTVNPGATTAPITGTFTVCVTGTTTLADATPGGTWTSSTPAVATVGSATGVVTGVSAGTATITYNVVSGAVTAVVTVIATPAPAPITGSGIVCTGTPGTLSNATPAGVWSSTTPAVATIGTSTGVVTGITNGTSTISYTVTNACGTGAATTIVTVSTPIAVAPVTGTLAICNGNSTTLSSTTPGGVWSSASPAVATIGAGTGVATSIAAGTATMSYTVTNAVGCTSAATATVTVNAAPAATTTPAGSLVLCTGGTAAVNASPTSAGFTYQWQDGGINIPGATSSSYTVSAAGNIRVLITNTTGCTGTSAVLAVTVSGAGSVVPTVTVSATPGINICSSVGMVNYSSSITNGGATPGYLWYVNSISTGITTPTFSYTPANGDVVRCELTSSLPCAIPAIVADSVTMTVSPTVTPTVAISPAPNDTVCTGQSATYTTVPFGGGTAPTYQWSLNGIAVATGPTYSHTPSNGDVITCQMSSNETCRTATVANSAPMTITVQAPVTNTVLISASSASIVAGENVTFVAIAANAGPSATYQWFIDGVAVPGATNITFTTNLLTNGQTVHCKVTTTEPCVLPHTAMSGGFKMTVTTGVWEVTGSGNAFSLNPNPNKGTFVINGKVHTDEAIQITVTNVLGQTVYTRDTKGTNGMLNEQISLPAGLPKGNYFVIANCNGERVVFRMTLD
jgi:hypothetical protein